LPEEFKKRGRFIKPKIKGSKFYANLNQSFGSHIFDYPNLNLERNQLRLFSEDKVNTTGYKLGLGYRIDEKLSLNMSGHFLTSLDTMNYSAEVIIGYEPPEEPEMDSIPIYGFVDFSDDIKYKTIDFSAEIEYKIARGRWHFSVLGGPLFNYSFRPSGQILISEASAIELESEASPYKRKVGLGFSVGFRISKPLFDKFEIYFSPNYKRYFSTITNIETSLPTRMGVAAMDIGIKYHF
ncbi:MAG: hypothetical protein HKO66_11590, partial [Saprospiraceae bacterium]|nr:hypothetical protein [Saprospiraceae bacterium]